MLVQDCSSSRALAVGLPQDCTKGINSHGIYLSMSENSGFSTRSVNFTEWKTLMKKPKDCIGAVVFKHIYIC